MPLGGDADAAPIHLAAVALLAALAFPLQAAVDVAPVAKPSYAQPAMSPNGSRIAFVSGGAIWEVPATGGAAHLMVADKGADSRPLFSPAGDKLAFVSDTTGDGDIYILGIASGKLTRVTSTDGRDELSGWSHDGQWIYFSSARQHPLVKEPPVARQLTSTSGEKTDAQFSPDGKNIYYLDGDKLFPVPLAAGGKSKAIALDADVDIDFATARALAFEQAWTWLRDNFHDPNMHGVDWNAVRAEYAPLIAGAPTPASVNWRMNLLVGELNASHSGARPATHPKPVTGRGWWTSAWATPCRRSMATRWVRTMTCSRCWKTASARRPRCASRARAARATSKSSRSTRTRWVCSPTTAGRRAIARTSRRSVAAGWATCTRRTCRRRRCTVSTATSMRKT
jgi:hypothetical protein